MSVVKLSEYGRNLSGRPLGRKTYSIIIDKYEPPYELDFIQVISIGSSFADEVVAKLAEKNQGKIRIINANNIIKKCLKDVSKEKKIELILD